MTGGRKADGQDGRINKQTNKQIEMASEVIEIIDRIPEMYGAIAVCKKFVQKIESQADQEVVRAVGVVVDMLAAHIKAVEAFRPDAPGPLTAWDAAAHERVFRICNWADLVDAHEADLVDAKRELLKLIQ